MLELSSEGLDILCRVTRLDWSNIEPAIFGALFERSLDPSKRSQLGAHYTSKEDILLIVEPVLMTPLRRRWEEVRSEVEELVQKREATTSKAWVTNYTNMIQEEILGFLNELSEMQVLDPACGSGNFLYVALRQLLELEKEVIVLAGDVGMTRPYPQVSPAQMHGIEINEYAHELAEATIWIGYIQWLHENGFGRPSEPILKPLENIVQKDAVLAYDDAGEPVAPRWPEADVVIGNPPYLGSRKMRPNLGDEYCDALEKAYEGRIEGSPDLVCYWFEKARALVEQEEAQRVGLLATQAIRGGTNRQVLERILDTGNIFMAWSDREWILDGAMVHVSLVGFDDGSEDNIILDGTPVRSINPDLTGGVDVSVAEVLEENEGIAFQGIILRGSFQITREQAEEMLSAQGNPNGRPNADVIKPRRTGRDVLHHPSDPYVIDFGLDMSMEEASQYVAPFEYVREHVYPMRQQANQASAREYWWLHWNPRPGMRQALSELSRYIATPRVAKHRVFVWLDEVVLPDAQLVVFARDDHYFFGVLHSTVHEAWARRQGTQLRDAESGFRYTLTTTFETFPFPWPPGEEPLGDLRVEAIAVAARDLVEKRQAWLSPPDATEKELKKRTLTNLYNEYPTWLELAHQWLDEAVLDAYGWPHDLDDEEILRRLLELNLERADRS